MTDDEAAEALRSVLYQYGVLRSLVESVREKAEMLNDQGMSGVAFSAHMVAESISVYSVALKKAFVDRIEKESK